MAALQRWTPEFLSQQVAAYVLTADERREFVLPAAISAEASRVAVALYPMRLGPTSKLAVWQMQKNPSVFYPPERQPTDIDNFRALYTGPHPSQPLVDGDSEPATGPQVGDTWYRYDDIRYAAPLDEYENPRGPGRVAVELRSYQIQRVTPKGVWLSRYFGAPRFVRLSARKRFAYPTPEEALESFMARKTRQLSILRAQAEKVERALAAGKALQAKSLPVGAHSQDERYTLEELIF